MILSEPEKTVKELIKNSKRIGKRWFVYNFILIIYTYAGVFAFFYIEHCYDVVPPKVSYREDKFVEICQENSKLVNISFKDEKLKDFLTKIDQVCGNDTTKTEDIECVLNQKNILKWTEFVYTILFTIGKASKRYV